jgi:hypothetical protein
MSATPNLGLPYIDAGQAQKHVTHNEALRSLDTLVQLAVVDRDLSAPPDTPAEGQRWIVKATATDAWAGHENHIAAWQDGAWQFSAPVAGWVAYVIDEEILAAWDGSAWNAVSAEGGGGGGEITELQNLSLLGIGATADSTNPLSATLNNALWSAKSVADGGDGTLRYIMNKESADKTLSLLFQDNFVGCAEIGLAGDDDFHFKVSPDGTAWLEAVRIDRATGKVSFPVSGGPREMLGANRTYYVRTDGSDSNDGFLNTSAGAFLTLQKAIDVAYGKIDLAGFDVTIQIADGTYTAGCSIIAPQLGPGTITLQGNNTSPANVVISQAGDNAIFITNGAYLAVKDLKLQTTTSGHGILATRNGVVEFQNLNFGTCAGRHIRAEDGAIVSALGNYAISGGAANHWQASGPGATIRCTGKTIALSGTPNFSSAFAYALIGGVMVIDSNSFSGSATGVRYLSQENSILHVNGGGATYLPGNSAGSVANGGIYI